MTRERDNLVLIKKGILFSDKVKLTRKRKKMTQATLSKISNVPLDTIRSIENRRIKTPGVFIASSIVSALDESLEKWLEQIESKSKR